MAGSSGKSLEQTPTWAVAAVCTVFVVCSLAAERGLFKFGRYLKRKKQKELYHTLEVIRNGTSYRINLRHDDMDSLELLLLSCVELLIRSFLPYAVDSGFAHFSTSRFSDCALVRRISHSSSCSFLLQMT